MDTSQETLYTIALTRIAYFNLNTCLRLYRRLGSATAIMEHRHDIKDVLPEATPRLIQSLADISDAMSRAEAELEFDEAHNIQPLTYNDNRYPERLRQCDDAPLVLFYRGTADLNQQHIISMVGTRHCTIYGQDVIRKFMADLKAICPNTLVVSGLAYGVDVNAHCNAMENGIDTLGILAHGLDNLYPAAHRDIAAKMLSHGGLATEFMTMTNADKMNFVRRNRIIAGLADATILVESAAKGGGLITARIAQDYGRDVFAFPGNIDRPYSEGCNKLIRDNVASLVTSADDFAMAMGWTDDNLLVKARQKGIERQMFPELNADETKIVDLLSKSNDLQINIISVKAGLPIAATSAALFSLELKGVTKMFAGGTYHLL